MRNHGRRASREVRSRLTRSRLTRSSRPEVRGYALLAIFLALSILTITLAVAVPAMKTSIRREQENESIYRARQYVTAIRRYYHKFGAYPPDLAHLKETNNTRFLRREWKDPLTRDGKWRFLHFGDMLQPNNNPLNGSGNNRNPGGGPAGGIGGPGLGGPSLGGEPGDGGGGLGIGGSGVGNPGLGGPAGFGQGGGGAFGGPSNGIGGQGIGGPGIGGPGIGGAGNGLGGSSGGGPAPGGFLGGGPSDGRSLGGGPIIGVASLDTRPGIHEFRHKSKPSEWLFIYDPSKDTSLRGAGGGMPPGVMPQGGFGGIGGPGGPGAPPPPPPPSGGPPSH